jgi:hypothetical protein
MAETPPDQAERRCHTCGAVVYEGAAWCGMCFTPVESDVSSAQEPPQDPQPDQDPERSPEPVRTDVATISEGQPSREDESVATIDRSSNVPMWPCPVCETRNPIALDSCATCGASFAALMRQETAQANVAPHDAFLRSLLFPGLGHQMVPGRAIDGFSRGVLFAMLLIATLMLGLSGVHAGAVFFLFLLYLLATLLVYLVTAFEASRLAQGGEPLVSSRTLLWTTVGILLLSVGVVSFVIGTAARR